MDCRLWHPSGGVPYALSYRLQKGMEALAHEALQKAILQEENPRLRMVVAGHLHVTAFTPIGGVLGLQAGCFEGQTNYLKRKGLHPAICGWVLRIRLTDGGMLQGVTADWQPYLEIEDDWRNYPMPSETRPKVEPLFQY